MKRSSKGFTVIEIMFFILVAILIAGAIFFVGKRMGEKSSDNKPAASSQSQTSKKSDPNDISTWKTFEDTQTGASFKYPNDWSLAINEESASDFMPATSSGTLTSPSGRVTLNYSNFIDGLGGGTCPEAFPCPTIEILKIEDVPGSKETLKYVEKIIHWKGENPAYQPVMGLLSAEKADKLKVGKTEGNDFYMLASFSQERSGYFVIGAFGEDPYSFTDRDEAFLYLDSANANIAEDILKSFTIK